MPPSDAVAPSDVVRLESPMLVTSVKPRIPFNDGDQVSNDPESHGQHEDPSKRQPANEQFKSSEERMTVNRNVTKDGKEEGLHSIESPGILSSNYRIGL